MCGEETGGEAMIIIYYMKKKSIFKKEFNPK